MLLTWSDDYRAPGPGQTLALSRPGRAGGVERGESQSQSADVDVLSGPGPCVRR